MSIEERSGSEENNEEQAIELTEVNEDASDNITEASGEAPQVETLEV